MREARKLGFDIEDIRALLDLSDGKPSDAAGRVKAARAHLAAVARRMAKLRRLGANLERVAAADVATPSVDVVHALIDP